MALTTVNPGLLDSQAQYTGFKNRIINGAMMIDQRNAGASVTITANSTYTLDRWSGQMSQASKYSIQQNAGSVTPPAGFTNYLGATSLSAYTVGAAETFGIRQVIEGLNIADFGWGTANAATVTISFWVRSSLTGTFGGAIRNSAADRSYPFSYTISSANTWEQKSITIAGDTTGTWLTTNGVGVSLFFSLGTGSTISATAGSWVAGNYTSATGATSVVGTNGATFYITGVQLEKGSTATSFDYRPYGTELALCQRYFYMHATGVNAPINNAFNYSATSANGYVQFPATMRTSPSIYSSTGVDYYAFVRNGGVDAFNSITIDLATVTGATIYNNTQISGTAGQAGYFYNNNASAYLGFSAEL